MCGGVCEGVWGGYTCERLGDVGDMYGVVCVIVSEGVVECEYVCDRVCGVECEYV